MKFLFLYILLSVSSFAYAQHTQTYISPDVLLQNSVQLLDKQLFRASQNELHSYLQLSLTPAQRMEGEYYNILNSLYLGQENIITAIETFAKQYPATLQTANLYEQAANYYFDKGNYEEAIRYYENSKSKNPKTEQEYKVLFNLGYSYFYLQRFDAAKISLDKIKNENHAFTYPSNYYTGYIAYTQNLDSEALTDLEKASNDAKYKLEAEKIIPLIYYRKKQYTQVIAHYTSLETNINSLKNSELLVLGDSYYHTKQYLEAAKYLDRYAENQEILDRNISYTLGYALAEAGDNTKAQAYFAIVAEGNDSLAQNAAYNLGISSLKIKQKEAASNAFDKARKMTFDSNLQEQAALDYAKVCYDLKDFNRTIEACMYFEKIFPNSNNHEQITHLLTESYLYAGNYIQALNYIEKIPNKNKKVQATYQRLAYNQAVEMFNKDQYNEAEKWLKKSLKFSINKDLANSSTYFLGEMYSYEEKYDSALWYYNRLASNSLEYNEAFYGKAYADYNKKNYTNAANNFKKYIELTSNKANQADAQVRLADCFYVQKDYENAFIHYEKAAILATVDIDYIHYQQSMVLVNQEKYDEALAMMDKIVLQDANAKYYESVLYQKGLINFDLNHKTKAVDLFTQLIDTRVQSPLRPNALSKRAICYQLLNEQQKAIEDFREIVLKHSNSQVAEDAIQGLQEMQEKGYEIPDYQILIDKFNLINPNSKAAVEGEYASAKLHYDNAAYSKAIQSLQNFIKKYPENELLSDAYYFLAASYDQSNAYENALFAYSKVKGNYEIRALQRAGEIEMQRGNYLNANKKYEMMLQNTLNKRYEGNAIAGMLQCNFYLRNYEKVQDLANQLYNKNHTKFWSLADLFLAKIEVEKNNFSTAILQIQKTTQNAQDVYAAEAQYLLAVVLRKQKKYEESTKACIELRSKYSAYMIWVYEAFLLIADNYIDLQNKFQAKATLQSIIDASTDEKIKVKAQQKLTEIGQ